VAEEGAFRAEPRGFERRGQGDHFEHRAWLSSLSGGS
jgi:hypothetical protein